MKAGTGVPPDPQRFHSLSEAGARNAAAALSQIIGRPLSLEVPWATLSDRLQSGAWIERRRCGS